MLSEYSFRPEEGLVCPRCGKKSIVLHGDSTYVCIDNRCGFRNDVSDGSVGGVEKILVGFFGVIVLVLMLQGCASSPHSSTSKENVSRFWQAPAL